MLTPSGEIHVALRDDQGGVTAASMEEWRMSWMAPEFAALHNLLLIDMIPFKVTYDLSSYRGRDKNFSAKDPIMYIFSKPRESPRRIFAVDPKLQLCCRHELHIDLTQIQSQKISIHTEDDIVSGNAVAKLVQSVVPSGVHVEVPIRKFVKAHGPNGDARIAVFLIVYCGESIPLTRHLADECRKLVEGKVMTCMALRMNRAGRMVSRPFPHPLLQHLIDEKT